MGLRYRKPHNRSISMTTGVLIGILIALLITAGIGALVALLVANEQLPIESMQYAAIMLWLLSAFTGGTAAGKAATEKKLIACFTACGVYLLILFGTSITLFDSLGQTVWLGALCVMAGCIGAALIIQKPQKRSKRLRKIKVSR